MKPNKFQISIIDPRDIDQAISLIREHQVNDKDNFFILGMLT